MGKGKRYEVLGVGTPLLDHLISVSPEYLDSIPGEKYGMETVTHEEMVQLIENSGSVPRQIAGGSCANAIKGLASLGRKCAFTGKVGSDPNGNKVVESLTSFAIEPLLRYSLKPTARVVCLISPDGKRTCRSCLGAAEEWTPEDLEPAHFNGVRWVHIEGYTLLYPGVTEHAMRLAKEGGAHISLDLGSFEIVETYKPHIKNLIREYVEVVFANEQEALALTGEQPELGCRKMHDLCPIAVVMMGKSGCWTATSAGLKKHPAYPVEPVDTTGAGDLFASGFLHGCLSGRSIEVSARWGALLGRAVVQVIGAEIPADQWPALPD